jgi:hypothetical protein
MNHSRGRFHGRGPLSAHETDKKNRFSIRSNESDERRPANPDKADPRRLAEIEGGLAAQIARQFLTARARFE